MKKTLLASAIASALVVGVSAQAADVKVSGQVSRVIVSPDDDAGDELQFVDNNISGSRFRIKASHDLGNGMEAGSRFEAQFQSNKGNSNNGGTFGDTGNKMDFRYQDLYLSGAFGKISLGKGDGAGNGTTESDLSGTYIIAAVNATDLYGGFIIEDDGYAVDDPATTDKDESKDATVEDFYGEVDAYSRNNRLRYDSNNFNGFSFAASYGQQEVTEFAVKYAGGSDIKYQVQGFIGSIGESAEGKDNGDERMGVSGSVLLSNGLNFTAAYSDKDSDLASDKDREHMWVKLGYKMGKHAFAVDYGETEDTTESTSTTTEAETMGISYVFAPAKGVELFAGYREYSTDDAPGLSADTKSTDPEFITVGSRVKF